tara:strand:- start:35 stop:313 length:279 start_codon:yes stop_codon:yes gene_type:complete
MSKVLVILNADWADEFQCQEYLIVDSLKEAERVKQACVENGGYFGTNEGWEEGEFEESYITTRPISEEYSGILEGLLGDNFGTGILGVYQWK